jgi:hypothetical protein
MQFQINAHTHPSTTQKKKLKKNHIKTRPTNLNKIQNTHKKKNHYNSNYATAKIALPSTSSTTATPSSSSLQTHKLTQH